MFSLEALAEINRVAYTLGELGLPESAAITICTKPTHQKNRKKMDKLHKFVLGCAEVVNIDRMLTERGA